MKYFLFFLVIGFVISTAFVGMSMSMMGNATEAVLNDPNSVFNQQNSYVEQVRAQEMRDSFDRAMRNQGYGDNYNNND